MYVQHTSMVCSVCSEAHARTSRYILGRNYILSISPPSHVVSLTVAIRGSGARLSSVTEIHCKGNPFPCHRDLCLITITRYNFLLHSLAAWPARQALQ